MLCSLHNFALNATVCRLPSIHNPSNQHFPFFFLLIFWLVLQWQPSFLIAFINAASLCPLHKNVSEKQLFYLSYTRGRCTLAWGINSTYLSYSFVLRLSILYLIAQKIWWKKDKSWQYLWCCSHIFKKKTWLCK